MHLRLRRLSLISATLLLSLTSALQLGDLTLGLSGLSAQAQITPDQRQLANQVTQLSLMLNRQFKRGQFRSALETLQRILALARKNGWTQLEGDALNRIGLVYDNLGQYVQALKYYEQALIINQKVRNKAGEGVAFNNIGTVYLRLGQYPQALKYYEQALFIAKEKNNTVTQGIILHNFGTTYRQLGQFPQALKLLEQAWSIFKTEDDKRGQRATLNQIGLIYYNQGQYAQALKYHEQALAICQQVQDKVGEGQTLSRMGAVYNALGQYADAEKVLLAAIEIWEFLRFRLTDADNISFFDTNIDNYQQLQQALVAQGKIDSALEFAERGRARAFIDLLAQRQSNNPKTRPRLKPLTIQDIQQIAGVQNATLVEYSVMANQILYIWVIKPTGDVAFKQVDLKSLNTSLKDLVTNSRDSIGVRGRGLGVQQTVNTATQSEKLQQLHKLLIEPIAQSLPTDPNAHVIFIPQGELFLVPFPALQDKEGKYLIEKHTILTAPAIQVLQLTQEKRQNVSGTNVVVVGNPMMPSNIMNLSGEQIELSPLPGAEQEALAIAQLLNTTALTGNAASEITVRQQMTKARIIHLATHGLLDDFKQFGVPGAIALAPKRANRLNDGLLTSDEILDMELNAELVVLSACDTGRGNITGDGVVGLSRSFISAGVPSVIVSLWSVPDAPTAFLMTEFYRQWQQNPDKAQSLRQAILATMKQHPNPKDWAAFTLIGDAS
ncbi:CHAT domain-containing tetratricopeptide repeat protein [Allocoleopsis sp.]|uniref:CHAT domain-containing protein n=1 Tax=Allocoleopsis sp. TaxID=3088169 RepID=UPI002FD6A0C1